FLEFVLSLSFAFCFFGDPGIWKSRHPFFFRRQKYWGLTQQAGKQGIGRVDSLDRICGQRTWKAWNEVDFRWTGVLNVLKSKLLESPNRKCPKGLLKVQLSVPLGQKG